MNSNGKRREEQCQWSAVTSIGRSILPLSHQQLARRTRTRIRSMKQHQEEARGHLLAGTTSRHDAEAPAPITKGCATFWVGAEEDQAPQRFAVPVTLLGHPRILELLVEAQERYGYAHDGTIVVPCGVERFQKAVDAARDQERHRHHHNHHFRIPHLAACFRPSHIVA